jgi:hypothetical protein
VKKVIAVLLYGFKPDFTEGAGDKSGISESVFS